MFLPEKEFTYLHSEKLPRAALCGWGGHQQKQGGGGQEAAAGIPRGTGQGMEGDSNE